MNTTYNIWNLSVLAGEMEVNLSEVSRTTTNRFTHSASLLGENGILGLQLSADKKGLLSGTVFSDAGSKVTLEDLNWIFGECADIEDIEEESQKEFVSDLFGDGRKVYAITTGFCDLDEVEVADTNDADLAELLGMMCRMDAILRFVTGKNGSKIFLSLPDKMPLRMHSILSMTFSGMKIKEIEAGEYDSADSVWTYEMERMMGSILSMMMEHPDKSSSFSLSVFAGDDPNEEETEKRAVKLICEIEFPIEQLALSTRTYLSLKRAGINTLYDLRRNRDNLKDIRGLGKKEYCEVIDKITAMADIPIVREPVAERKSSKTKMQELDELIGLESVKAQVKKIAAYARMKKEMDPSADLSMALNMEFVGNPGTAKTTVARIVAGIFHELGLLPSGEVLEAGRADLVAMYEGQTANKVRELFMKARGKVLFIDEAYSILESHEGEFGDEAISALVQEMENRRNDTVVILAGYPKEMKEFFDRNPGLRSRVPFTIDFKDYSVDEMIRITEFEASKRGFKLAPKSEDRIRFLCRLAAKDPVSGNGRFCRNMVENAVLNYASRVYGRAGCAKETEAKCVLKPVDFMMPSGITLQEKKTFGFKTQ
ncbi:ATPases of the AAA+ class [Ruminococcaceae bacterium YRB3002]|nr:ATPases of the AAA+ class [Ruminococcaceae bacterium YRB3002]